MCSTSLCFHFCKDALPLFISLSSGSHLTVFICYNHVLPVKESPANTCRYIKPLQALTG